MLNFLVLLAIGIFGIWLLDSTSKKKQSKAEKALKLMREDRTRQLRLNKLTRELKETKAEKSLRLMREQRARQHSKKVTEL